MVLAFVVTIPVLLVVLLTGAIGGGIGIFSLGKVLTRSDPTAINDKTSILVGVSAGMAIALSIFSLRRKKK